MHFRWIKRDAPTSTKMPEDFEQQYNLEHYAVALGTGIAPNTAAVFPHLKLPTNNLFFLQLPPDSAFAFKL